MVPTMTYADWMSTPVRREPPPSMCAVSQAGFHGSRMGGCVHDQRIRRGGVPESVSLTTPCWARCRLIRKAKTHRHRSRRSPPPR
jgi:hypothetical protein